MSNYLAIDIGAESGRMILGSVSDETLTFKEIHRFPNAMLNLLENFYWNIGHLYKEILTGLEKYVSVENVIPESIGIDTWGVDYGLL
jgi:rhamnulokinase